MEAGSFCTSRDELCQTASNVYPLLCRFLGDRLSNGSPYAVGPLSVQSVCPVCVCLSVTIVHCGQTVGRIKMKLDKQVGLRPGHIVLDGDPALPPQSGIAPTQFSAQICCGQMAAWIKMSLGTKVFLSPGDSVRWGCSPLPTKGVESPPQFSAHFCCGQMAGCIMMPLGTDVGLSPGDFVLDGHSSPKMRRSPQF